MSGEVQGQSEQGMGNNAEEMAALDPNNREVPKAAQFMAGEDGDANNFGPHGVERILDPAKAEHVAYEAKTTEETLQETQHQYADAEQNLADAREAKDAVEDDSVARAQAREAINRATDKVVDAGQRMDSYERDRDRIIRQAGIDYKNEQEEQAAA